MHQGAFSLLDLYAGRTSITPSLRVAVRSREAGRRKSYLQVGHASGVILRTLQKCHGRIDRPGKRNEGGA